MEFLGHPGYAQRLLLGQQTHQHGLDTTLGLMGRQVQDAQVFLGSPLRVLLHEPIIGQAEAAGGKQVRLITVIVKRSWLADQPIDNMPILDLVFAFAPQPRQLVHLLLGIPDLHILRI